MSQLSHSLFLFLSRWAILSMGRRRLLGTRISPNEGFFSESERPKKTKKNGATESFQFFSVLAKKKQLGFFWLGEFEANQGTEGQAAALK